MFFIYKKLKECIKQVEKQFAKFYRNENDIGSGIKEGGVSREKIFVVTKLFSTDGGRESAINAVKESFELMETDYIDQYLLHAPQGGKVLECYDVFLDYQKKGIIFNKLFDLKHH